jgi:hypothetical protein
MTHLVPLSPLLFAPGDRLTREEFLERWERMPDLKFAELIDGVVYMPSPVSDLHSGHEGNFQLVLTNYALKTPVCEYRPGATWIMLESAPQPDLALFVLPAYGGRIRRVKSLLSGAPELVVEISRSSRSYDLGPKLALYQRAGVIEYAAALVEEERIEWRRLEKGSYRLMSPSREGIYKSRAFPGLWLDSAAFWRGDKERLANVLEQGLNSEEHAQFLEKLRRKTSST